MDFARESFSLLERSGAIPVDLSSRLQRMIGFRNIAVHQYQTLDLDILESVIHTNLDDLVTFAEAVRTGL